MTQSRSRSTTARSATARSATARSTQKRSKANHRPEKIGRMVGTSQSMRRLIAQVKRFAPSEMSILIQGETGSGKELCAEAIHKLSQAQKKRWVAINCAALPPALLLAELFGCESGAFTNAHKRKGLIISADQGTLFLDEVGDLSLEAQAALLRVLETGELRSLGSDKVQKVNFRLICATHRDLPTLIQRGRFRADLYHRISTITLNVPALRERISEIPLIVTQLSLSVSVRLSTKAWKLLCSYQWPGNVRELKNIINRVQIERPKGFIRPDHLALPPMVTQSFKTPDHGSFSDDAVVDEAVSDDTLGKKIFTPRADKFLISGPPTPKPREPSPEPPLPPSPPPVATEVESVDPVRLDINYHTLEDVCPFHDLELLFTMMPTLSLEELKRAYVVHLLRRFEGNISETARVLKISRNQVYRLQDDQEIDIEAKQRSYTRTLKRKHTRGIVDFKPNPDHDSWCQAEDRPLRPRKRAA